VGETSGNGHTNETVTVRSAHSSGDAAIRKERFGSYYPRAFAFALSLTGDESCSKDVVAEAFGRIFASVTDLTEEEFAVELFTLTRELSRSSSTDRIDAHGLTAPEQELLAFVFDARLSHEEIRRLTGTTEHGLSSGLLEALRKLQSATSRATAPA
jgi:DNA-directed RNA polymerase specialized sigma24 family protein